MGNAGQVIVLSGKGGLAGGLTPTQRCGTPFPFSLHLRPLLPDVPTRSVCDANL